MAQVVPMKNWRQYDAQEYEQKKQALKDSMFAVREEFPKLQAQVDKSFPATLRAAALRTGVAGVGAAVIAKAVGLEVYLALAIGSATLIAAASTSAVTPAEKKVVEAMGRYSELQKELQDLERHRFEQYHIGHVTHQLAQS